MSVESGELQTESFHLMVNFGSTPFLHRLKFIYPPVDNHRGRRLWMGRSSNGVQIMSEVMERSLYERIGGAEAVDAAVDVFYGKVLADERIRAYFETVDMPRQRNKQKAFLAYVFGGPSNYKGKDMRAAHAQLSLTGADFDAVMEHLGATLQELNVPADLIGEAAGIAMSVKDDVLNH